MDRLEESYRRLHASLWRYLVVECGDVSAANDIETDAFVRAGGEAADAEDRNDELDRRIWSLAVESAAAARTRRRSALDVTVPSTEITVTLIDPDTPAVAGVLHPLDAMERLGEIQPPDLWPRIRARLVPPSSTPWFRHPGLVRAAAVVPLLVLAAFGVRWLVDPTTGSTAPPAIPDASSAPVRPSTPPGSPSTSEPDRPGDPLDVAIVLAEDEAGIWAAEPGRGVANLDPVTGDVRWRLEVDGTPDGVQGVPGIGWFVWSSFTAEDDHRRPVLLRVDPVSGEVVWRAEGRSGFDWASESLAVSGDQVFIADVADASEDRVWIAEPSRPAPGGRSSIRAHDVERGDLDFAVAVDGPVGATAGVPLVGVLPTGEEPVLLATVQAGLLSRIDPSDGAIVWSAPVDQAETYRLATTDDGSAVVWVSASPAGSYHLDIETGDRLADVTLPAPSPECRTVYGSVVEVSVAAGASSGPCLVVSEFQALRLRNDKVDPMTLNWSGRRWSIGPAETTEWSIAGAVFPVGPTVLDVEPGPDVTVWLLASDFSATAALPRTANSLGPVAVGMSVADAAELLDEKLDMLAHDTSSACVVVAGDPYSPFFRSTAAAGGLIITGIDPECP